MKLFLIYFIVILITSISGKADVTVHVNVPDYKRNFGVQVKGKNITRISISIPECLGYLAFEIHDGNVYTVESNKNCVMAVTYRKDEIYNMYSPNSPNGIPVNAKHISDSHNEGY